MALQSLHEQIMANYGRLNFTAALLLASLLAQFIGGCGQAGRPSANQEPTLERYQQAGVQRFTSGDYAGAAEQWKRAADIAKAQSRVGIQIDAQTNLGSAYEMLGQYDWAKQTLNQAVELAEKQKDVRRQVTALNALGAACTLKPDPRAVEQIMADHASMHDHGAGNTIQMPAGHSHSGGAAGCKYPPPECFNRALSLAAQLPHDGWRNRVEASIHDNLGNYYSDTKDFETATAEYQRCVTLAQDQAHDPLLEAKAHANAATCLLAEGDYLDGQAARAQEAHSKIERDMAAGLRHRAAEARQAAGKEDALALAGCASLPPSATKAFVFNQLGQTDEQLAKSGSTEAITLKSRANSDHREAQQTAESCGDIVSLSYAYGYLGHLKEVEKDWDAAKELTRKAISAAQKAQSPDSLYRWQWQMGRLLKASGPEQRDAAIDAYMHAADTVKWIRTDIALGNGNQRGRFSFRKDIGPMYFDLADLLLTKSEGIRDDKAKQGLLVEARSTIEQLKSAELEDYLHDDCVQLYKRERQQRNGRPQLQDTGVDGCAVIYIVPLTDRIELLVQVRSRLYEVQSLHSASELKQTTAEFGKQVRSVESSEYRSSAVQLYDWLIRPLAALLNENRIHTLVFVPDENLRTVPMSALYDGRLNQHLIEQYAVAVVPGLELTEAAKGQGGLRQSLLVSGLSQARAPEFPALPYVPIELSNVQQSLHAASSRELLDSNFILQNLEYELHNRPCSIMHIASHGHFGDDASKTFILTFNGAELTLDKLEKLIKTQEYDPRGTSRPVDLLVLSCCQTALGDDRAALGLAGVAVKSGARSALATLWSVNDASSALLITEFYHELATGSQSPGTASLSKAQALQEAQKALLNSDNLAYRHPFFWAPYLIIGNWQ